MARCHRPQPDYNFLSLFHFFILAVLLSLQLFLQEISETQLDRFLAYLRLE